MASPPKLRGLRMEDFKDVPSDFAPTMQKLIQTLNPALSDTSNALDRRLTLSANLATVTKTVTVTAPDWVTVNSETSGTLPYFGTNWSNYTGADFAEPAQYYVEDSGRVQWAGMVTNSGAPSAGDTLVHLPANISVDPGKPFVTVTNSGHGAVDLRVGQTLTYRSGGVTWLSLNPVSYHVDSVPAFAGAGWPLSLAPTGDDGRPLGTAVTAVLLSRAQDLTSNQNTTAHCAGNPCWAPDSRGGAAIKRVPGLTPGHRYQLTFILFG